MTTFLPSVPIDHPRPLETPAPELAVHIDDQYMHLICYSLGLPQPTRHGASGAISAERLRSAIDLSTRTSLRARLRTRWIRLQAAFRPPPPPTAAQNAALAHVAYLVEATAALRDFACRCLEHGYTIAWR
jgi:hypothetical protein